VATDEPGTSCHQHALVCQIHAHAFASVPEGS
jgi:hypothetical protein